MRGLIHCFLSRAEEGYVLRLESNLLMRNCGILCFSLCILGGETVGFIIYMLVLFVKTEKNFFFKSVALSEVAQVLACSSDSVACRRRVASVGRVVVTEENRSIRNEAYTEYVDPFIVCFMLSFILLAPLIHNLILSNGKVNTEF